jgi:tRNA modification GTPase
MHPLFGRALPPRHAVLSDFLDRDGTALDTGIALFFPAPHSYTGEDILELQAHGGPAVLQLVLRRCLELGARLAEPGEFSRRAFLNDKLDLAQAESVADLIDASSEAAARAATRSLKGEFSRQITQLGSEVAELRVIVEACIDFPDEDVEFLEEQGVRQKLRSLRERIGEVLRVGASGRLLRDGIKVVLVGRPNVGKSSLMNRLAGEEVAIVTDVPGTTRDTLRTELVLSGVPIHVVDTAGLREAQDVVEQLGIERTWKAAAEADVVVVVVDVRQGKTDADDDIDRRLPPTIRRIVAVNKIDLSDTASAEATTTPGEVRVSAKTGQGIDLLRSSLLEAAGWLPPGEPVFLARTRHLIGLAKAQSHIALAEERVLQLELMAEELKIAHLALDELTGEFTTEDLLGAIFSRFCIGK